MLIGHLLQAVASGTAGRARFPGLPYPRPPASGVGTAFNSPRETPTVQVRPPTGPLYQGPTEVEGRRLRSVSASSRRAATPN
ncbi:hypothetical protein GCM10009727_12750 [Actinomadura napierensis]|uniref:Uncharacterized protein n=1 Tax=Actinomadura napierensis TaxID=267854 RepID=A0ABN2YC81_9ACTN